MNTKLGSSRLMFVAAYQERRCVICGKNYMCTAEHVYKDCCTYTCYRKRQKKETKSEVAELTDKVQRCRERVAYFKHKINDPAVRGVKHDSAVKSMHDWIIKLEDAQMLPDMAKERQETR